jgi:hypothetical protein
MAARRNVETISLSIGYAIRIPPLAYGGVRKVLTLARKILIAAAGYSADYGEPERKPLRATEQ